MHRKNQRPHSRPFFYPFKIIPDVFKPDARFKKDGCGTFGGVKKSPSRVLKELVNLDAGFGFLFHYMVIIIVFRFDQSISYLMELIQQI